MKKNLTTALIIIFTFCTFSLNVNASINTSPSSVCQILKEEGLSTDGWKEGIEEHFYICGSRIKDLQISGITYVQVGKGGGPLYAGMKAVGIRKGYTTNAQNLQFFAEGDKNSVKSISLTLTILNNFTTKNFNEINKINKIAHQELLIYSSRLFQKVTNKNLSEKIKNSILKGISISEKIESTIVEVEKEEFRFGNYHIKFTIK